MMMVVAARIPSPECACWWWWWWWASPFTSARAPSPSLLLLLLFFFFFSLHFSRLPRRLFSAVVVVFQASRDSSAGRERKEVKRMNERMTESASLFHQFLSLRFSF